MSADKYFIQNNREVLKVTVLKEQKEFAKQLKKQMENEID